MTGPLLTFRQAHLPSAEPDGSKFLNHRESGTEWPKFISVTSSYPLILPISQMRRQRLREEKGPMRTP